MQEAAFSTSGLAQRPDRNFIAFVKKLRVVLVAHWLLSSRAAD